MYPTILKGEAQRQFYLLNNLLECTLDRFISQVVAHWIQHRDGHSIEHRNDFICVHGITGAGVEIHKDECPIENGTSVRCEAQVDRTF